MTKTCKHCNKEYTPSKGREHRQKYCTKRCREKDWIANNPERHKLYQRKCRLKSKILCRECGNKIPDDKRGCGVTMCSDECRTKSTKRSNARYRKSKLDVFRKHKESIGCSTCGYNRYGGSLDFHHLRDKKFRITHNNWCLGTPEVLDELNKCIIVCKNCHYELHGNYQKIEDNISA